MKQLNSKKGIGNLDKLIMTIVGVAMVLGVGLIVLGEFKGSMITTGPNGTINSTHYCAGAGGLWNGTTCTTGTATAFPTEYTATGTLVTKLATIPTWIGIIIVVAMAFLVMSYFYGRYKKGL